MNTVSIISAIASKTRAIGNQNKLLFRISHDLKRFRALTANHPIIMGRKTYESIGKPLPNRTNIVISRNPELRINGVRVVRDLLSAIKIAEASNGSDEIFVIGGGEIYKEALPYTNRIYLTVVESEESGDAFFPDYSDFCHVVSKEKHIDPQSGATYEFITLEK
jgi:dihydrofolate reductase